MSVSRELARRILAAMPEMDHHVSTEEKLAIALSAGLGVVRDPRPRNRTLYIILASPLMAMPLNHPKHEPVFLVGALSSSNTRRSAHSTGEVARFFRKRAINIGNERPEGYTTRWAPAATNSLAVIPVDGGDLADEPPTTADASGFDNTYEWFDLQPMPVGSIVYRIDSSGWLYLYQRLCPKYWGRVCVRVTTDVVDIFGIVADMYRERGGVMSLDKVSGTIPLMRPPVDRKKVVSRASKNKVQKRPV